VISQTNQTVQQQKAIESKIQTLTKEKLDLESVVTRIRAESLYNQKVHNQKMNELRTELEKLNSIKAGITEKKEPPIFHTMLATLRKARSIFDANEVIEEINKEEQKAGGGQ